MSPSAAAAATAEAAAAAAAAASAARASAARAKSSKRSSKPSRGANGGGSSATATATVPVSQDKAFHPYQTKPGSHAGMIYEMALLSKVKPPAGKQGPRKDLLTGTTQVSFDSITFSRYFIFSVEGNFSDERVEEKEEYILFSIFFRYRRIFISRNFAEYISRSLWIVNANSAPCNIFVYILCVVCFERATL